MASRRGLALVLFLIFLAMMASAAIVLIVALVFTPTRPQATVPQNATLFLRFTAPFPEVDAIELFPFADPQPTLRSLITTIEKAETDPRIRGMVVIPQVTGAMWGQLQELHAALTRFRASGKSLVVYFEYGGAAEYYLASAAERVLMMPAGTLDVSGMATYELFLRGTLDKLGVYPDMLQIGQFKTAANTMTERGFTPAHREMTESLNREAYEQLIAAVAEGRNRPADEIRRTIEQGPFLAEQAKAAGLIDDVAFDDQIDDAPPVQGTRRFDGHDYVREAPMTTAGANKIAVLYAVGTIASGKSSFDGVGGSVLGSDTFVDWIRKVRADSAIRAIVIRIDSPGGSAIASEVIWRELMLTRQVKPIIVSMGDVAASGGYYVAVPAHAIVAQPGTLTGSIGVVTGKYVLDGTMDKLGVGTESVSEGPYAEIYSPFKRFSPAERAKVEEQMLATYELFVRRVADGRQSTPQEIDAVAQGRVWTGRQARELGLVDELGGLNRAMELAREHAKLGDDDPVGIVVYPPKRGLYDVLANPLGVNTAARLSALWSGPAMPQARVIDAVAERFRLFRRGESLALMPNIFVPQH